MCVHCSNIFSFLFKRLCLCLVTCDSFLLPPPLEVVLVPTCRRCNLSPPPSDAASHYFLGGGNHALLRAQMLPPPYTKVSHTCVPRNVWLSRKKSKEKKIFFRGTHSISFKGNIFKRKIFYIFGECHTLLHASWSFERRREEEGLLRLRRFITLLSSAFLLPPYQDVLLLQHSSRWKVLTSCIIYMPP